MWTWLKRLFGLETPKRRRHHRHHHHHYDRRVPYFPPGVYKKDKVLPKPAKPFPNPHQVTSWRNIPERGKAFCDYWKTHRVTPKERRVLFDKLYKGALDLGFDERLDKMDGPRLLKLFALVDVMWLGGILGRYIRRHQIHQKCGVSPYHPKMRRHTRDKPGAKLTSTGVAGYCKWSHHRLGKILKINMSKDVLCHKDLFHAEKSPKTYSVGGILCSSPLRCMLQVFVHEMVHAMVEMFCPEKDGHGVRFRRINKALFGQTTYRHALGQKLGYTEENIGEDERVIYLKKNLKVGQMVGFYPGPNMAKLYGTYKGPADGGKTAQVIVGRSSSYHVPWLWLATRVPPLRGARKQSVIKKKTTTKKKKKITTKKTKKNQ